MSSKTDHPETLSELEKKDLLMRQLELAWKIAEDNSFFRRMGEDDKLKHLIKLAKRIDSQLSEETGGSVMDDNRYHSW